MQAKDHHGHLGTKITHFFVFLSLLACSQAKVTWVGNNDVYRQQYDIDSQLALLFHSQDQLYSQGARNFVFVNVVPFDRSPDGISSRLI